jgi:hypothetical protein
VCGSSTTFKTVPDVPFDTFELTLPEGPYSALAANGKLYTSKLAMPAEFVAPNGAVIHEHNDLSRRLQHLPLRRLFQAPSR